jgi:hypothetical protein
VEQQLPWYLDLGLPCIYYDRDIGTSNVVS